MTALDNKQLNDEGRLLWERKAEFWDALHGDHGNRFHRELVSPAVEKLLAIQPGERVLDVACGNGVMARRLSALGAEVTAVDFSPSLLTKAESRGHEGGRPIAYHIADATDENALTGLGEGTFDAVVCTMALMDMPVIAPLYKAARRLLRPAGRLVIATSHPAFNSNNPIFYAEMSDEAGSVTTVNGLKINAYLDVAPTKGSGAPNEPAPHYYFHRPLHQLLGEAFAANLILDALEEPTFQPQSEEPSRLLSWYSMPQIPPVLVFRLRPRSRVQLCCYM